MVLRVFLRWQWLLACMMTGVLCAVERLARVDRGAVDLDTLDKLLGWPLPWVNVSPTAPGSRLAVDRLRCAFHPLPEAVADTAAATQEKSSRHGNHASGMTAQPEKKSLSCKW